MLIRQRQRRAFQAVGTASAKACGQRQLEHLRPGREGSRQRWSPLPCLQSHRERAEIASPCRIWGPEDTHLKERPHSALRNSPLVPCGPDSTISTEIPGPEKTSPLSSVWLQPFCWEVAEEAGSRGLCGKEGRGWGSDGGFRGSREKGGKQLDPQAPPSHGRATEWPSVCRHFTFPLTASC